MRQGDDLTTIWRIEKADSRAKQQQLYISRVLQRFGGLAAAESRIVSGTWPEHSWGDLRTCLEALLEHRYQRKELLLAAPFMGILYDLHRVERSSDVARLLANNAADRFRIASKRKTAAPECRYWRVHFELLAARICLDPQTYDPTAIPNNIARLEDIVEDESLIPFSRDEASVELAGQYVRLDANPREIQQKLQHLRKKLGSSYVGPGAHWVLAAARLRPEIDYAVQGRNARAVSHMIHDYGRIVLPHKSFRHASLYAEWCRALGQPVNLTMPTMKLHLAIPPIGPFS